MTQGFSSGIFMARFFPKQPGEHRGSGWSFFPRLGCPLAAGSLAQQIKRFLRFAAHIIDVDAENPAAPLSTLPSTITVPTLLVLRAVQHGRMTALEQHHVDVARAQQDDIGALSRNQRAVLSAIPMAFAPLMVPISRHWVCVSRIFSSGCPARQSAMCQASRI